MKNIVILISGAGSNMGAIVTAARQGHWRERYGAQVAAVISNRPDAAGLGWAREQGIATAVVDHREHPSRDSFDARLAQEVERHQPWILALAGFMRILGNDFVRRFEGRMVNVHPSLLPAFTGLHTHRRAIEAGCRFGGATVHRVTAELDHGPILDQAVVPILPGDTPEALAGRVLSQEHIIYPRAIAALLAQEA